MSLKKIGLTLIAAAALVALVAAAACDDEDQTPATDGETPAGQP
jgi:hypothetical protein